jgi:hypothetical protein
MLEERCERFEVNVLEALKDIANSLRLLNALVANSSTPFTYTKDYDEF